MMTNINIPKSLNNLDEKIIKHFPGLVVRKELTKELKQNAVVPTYVLEYLLGQHSVEKSLCSKKCKFLFSSFKLLLRTSKPSGSNECF